MSPCLVEHMKLRLLAHEKLLLHPQRKPAEQAVIFTNYNRADDEQSKPLQKSLSIFADTLEVGYQLIRPDDPKNDVLIREA
jgi:hypothetical protein